MTRRKADGFQSDVAINRRLGEEQQGERQAARRARDRHLPVKGTTLIKSAGVGVRSDPRVIDFAAGNVTKDGDIVTVGGNLDFGMIVSPKAQSTADNASAGTTAETAMTVSLALPAGTWRISCEGSLLVTNASGNVSVFIQIDGTDGADTTLSVATEARLHAASTKANVAGGTSVDVKVRYRATSAGTTSARNPSATVTAVRTA